MAETEKSLSKEQIFRQVKQLCMKADFAPSRRLICQAAGLTPPDPMKISRAFILSQTQNKIVHQMLDIEQAFARLRKTFPVTNRTKTRLSSRLKIWKTSSP